MFHTENCNTQNSWKFRISLIQILQVVKVNVNFYFSLGRCALKVSILFIYSIQSGKKNALFLLLQYETMFISESKAETIASCNTTEDAIWEVLLQENVCVWMEWIWVGS